MPTLLLGRMPSFAAVLVSLIAIPFCFYMSAERRDETKRKRMPEHVVEPDSKSR